MDKDKGAVMDFQQLRNILLFGGSLSFGVTAGLIAFLLNYHPNASTVRLTDQSDAGIPDSSVDTPLQDPWPDELFQRSYDPDVTDDKPDLGQDARGNITDGGSSPAKAVDAGHRFVIKNPGDDPEIRKRAWDQEFDRFMAASRGDLWNSAFGQAEKDVPAEDRYCWNMSTAIAASFSLRQEELSGLIHSDRFADFPMLCPPRPQNP